ncbi:jg14248 [Pararge aegeria aegeria]|uniref:Jg14248 protein n=1 Tax=Pararge aegeria aegeria TaxID=348720 RepID=A0A8S4RJL0_9NEOP|nr:jg14248 [Pararge aegeria aegeria]
MPQMQNSLAQGMFLAGGRGGYGGAALQGPLAYLEKTATNIDMTVGDCSRSLLTISLGYCICSVLCIFINIETWWAWVMDEGDAAAGGAGVGVAVEVEAVAHPLSMAAA